MRSSLRSLLAGILDYAGLFPPAKLPLDQAIRQYASYQVDPDSWMLGRFVCPAERLGELEPYLPNFLASGSPLCLSVLGRGGKSTPELLAGVRADALAIAAFQDRHKPHVKIQIYEARLPVGVFAGEDSETARQLLDEIAGILDAATAPPLTPYFEPAPGYTWHATVRLFNKALAEVDGVRLAQGKRHVRPAGFKLRCGGLEASSFPSPEQVAMVLTACRDADVPVKFTAGLHHPFRHWNASLNTSMHGFLNIFAAGVLAHAHQLDECAVVRILADEAAEHFTFDHEGMAWTDVRASVADIEAARRSAVVSFGSCSFDEPREKLRAMHLLDSGEHGESAS